MTSSVKRDRPAPEHLVVALELTLDRYRRAHRWGWGILLAGLAVAVAGGVAARAGAFPPSGEDEQGFSDLVATVAGLAIMVGGFLVWHARRIRQWAILILARIDEAGGAIPVTALRAFGLHRNRTWSTRG